MTTRMTSTHCTSTIAWRFTTWTPTSTSTESTHECAHCHTSSLIIHTHLAQVRALPALHSWSSTCHPCVIHVCELFTLNSTLYFPAFLLSVFLFPFFHLSDEQQPELNKKIMESLCDSANNGGEDTYDFLYLPTLGSSVPF